MSQLLLLNPRKRRASSKRRKARSPAQKAATARMLAARFGRQVKRNPVAKRRAAVAGRQVRRRVNQAVAGFRASGAMVMLKGGAIGGAGAVLNDILFAQAARVLPASIVSPVNVDGSTNWTYFGAKAGVAVLLGMYGSKVPGVGSHAGALAQGALSVLSYQVLRGMVPASITLAGYNPAPTMARPRLNAYTGPAPRLAAVGGMGAYETAPGATAAAMIARRG